MPKLGQKGIAHLLLPIILVIGIIAGVYLITSGNPLKLFSRASNSPIVFKSLDGKALPTSSDGTPQATSSAVRIEFTSSLGSATSNVKGVSTALTLDGFKKAFGAVKGKDKNYDPNYDANNDGKINISDFSLLKDVLNGKASQTNPSQVIKLDAGWNAIGLTIDKSIYKAEDFLKDLDGQAQPNARVTQISRFVNGSSQEVHTLGQQANNFDIKPGEGYLVRSTRSGVQATLIGNPATQISLVIPQGYSYISLVTVPGNINNAENLLQEMKKQTININQISIYQNGNWQSHLINNSANNFSLEAGKAYLIRNNNASTTFNLSTSIVSPSPTASASAAPVTTVSYRFAEDPTSLDAASYTPYTQDPMVVNYTFKDSSPGKKFIWADFKDSTGKVDRKSASIDIVAKSSIAPSATLTVNISKTDYSQDWNYLDLTGNIKGLSPNKSYVVMVCYQEYRTGCPQSDSFTTNSSGEAKISNLRIVVQYIPNTSSNPEIIGIGDEPSSYSKGLPICPTFNTKSGEPCLSALFSVPASRPASLSLTLTTKQILPSRPPSPSPSPVTSSTPTPSPSPTPTPSPIFYTGPAFTISSSNSQTLTCKKGVNCSYQTTLTYKNATPSHFDTYDISASSPNSILQFSSFEGGMTSGVSRYTGTKFAPGDSNYTTVQVNIPGNLTSNLTSPTTWTAYMYFNGYCNLATSSTCRNYQAGVWTLNIKITN